MLEKHLSCIYLSCNESGNVKYKPELFIITYWLLNVLSFFLFKLVELSSRNLIVNVKQTNRGEIERHMSQPYL